MGVSGSNEGLTFIPPARNAGIHVLGPRLACTQLPTCEVPGKHSTALRDISQSVSVASGGPFRHRREALHDPGRDPLPWKQSWLSPAPHVPEPTVAHAFALPATASQKEAAAPRSGRGVSETQGEEHGTGGAGAFIPACLNPCFPHSFTPFCPVHLQRASPSGVQIRTYPSFKPSIPPPPPPHAVWCMLYCVACRTRT